MFKSSYIKIYGCKEHVYDNNIRRWVLKKKKSKKKCLICNRQINYDKYLYLPIYSLKLGDNWRKTVSRAFHVHCFLFNFKDELKGLFILSKKGRKKFKEIKTQIIADKLVDKL